MPDTEKCVNNCLAYPGYSVYPIGSTTCQKCYYTCLTCSLPHLDGRCVTCDATIHRIITNSSYCQCNVGYADVGLSACQSCSTTITNCLTCTSSTYCTQCSGVFLPSPDHTQCYCPSGGPLVSGICLSYLGCLVANNLTNSPYCQTCDASNHFEQVLSNLTCTCMSGYYEGNGTCLDICGDGRLMNLSAGCDVGNTLGLDGCSSTCQI